MNNKGEKMKQKIQIPPPYNPDDYELSADSIVRLVEFRTKENKVTLNDIQELKLELIRPIPVKEPEPKRWFYVKDSCSFSSILGHVLELDECAKPSIGELVLRGGPFSAFELNFDEVLEVTDLGGPDYKPEPVEPFSGGVCNSTSNTPIFYSKQQEQPLWTHEQLASFHQKNPHAVWQSKSGCSVGSIHGGVIVRAEAYEYSLDLGKTWNEPRGEV